MPFTVRQFCKDVLIELGVSDPTETPDAETTNFIRGKLNRVLDRWNAQPGAVYADQLLTFTLTASLQPHTIGIAANTPTWEVSTARPDRISSANLLVNATRYPIDIYPFAAWMGVAVPEETTTWPYQLYYDPGWPNGSIYFWPVPSAAYEVELFVPLMLAALTLDDVFTLPPGYLDALTLTVAEESANGLGKAVTPTLALSATKARAVIFAANNPSPRIPTRDYGVPGGRGGWFDYRSGTVR